MVPAPDTVHPAVSRERITAEQTKTLGKGEKLAYVELAYVTSPGDRLATNNPPELQWVITITGGRMVDMGGPCTSCSPQPPEGYPDIQYRFYNATTDRLESGEDDQLPGS